MHIDYPVEVSPPDIEPYRAGNVGVDYVTRLDGDRPGPRLMISALVHGNELCGAIVLDRLLGGGFRPRRGSLTLAFVNVAAYRNFDRRAPLASRLVDEDFNRLWDAAVLDHPDRDSVELRRARELRPLLDDVDALLDLHSMQHPTAPLLLCGPAPRGRALALALGYPLHVVSDRGHAAGTRMRDYAPFIDPGDGRNALLVECGQHWRADTVAVAWQTALRFLDHFDMLDETLAAEPRPPVDAPRLIEVTETVTIETDRFRFVDDFLGMEVIPGAGSVIAWDGDRPVATPYDDCVLIMPSARPSRGQSAVRLGRVLRG